MQWRRAAEWQKALEIDGVYFLRPCLDPDWLCQDYSVTNFRPGLDIDTALAINRRINTSIWTTRRIHLLPIARQREQPGFVILYMAPNARGPRSVTVFFVGLTSSCCAPIAMIPTAI